MGNGTRKSLVISTDRHDDTSFQELVAPEHDGDGLAAVLGDPEIGNFTVQRLHNASAFDSGIAIEDFFTDARIDDTLVFYFSGHGVKDLSGRLYFAMPNTRHDRLSSTALSSAFLHEQLIRSRSRRKLVILDCCYAGAFPLEYSGMKSSSVDPGFHLSGQGTVVMASSTAIEYAFENERGVGLPYETLSFDRADRSVFTRVLIEGLRSGAADLDGDGLVDVTELYEFVFNEVNRTSTAQTPTFTSRLEGKMVVARSPRGARTTAEDAEDSDAQDLRIALDTRGKMDVTLGRRSVLLGVGGLMVRPAPRAGSSDGERWTIQVLHERNETDLSRFIEYTWPGTEVSSRHTREDIEYHVHLPGGKTFSGSTVTMRLCERAVARSGGFDVTLPKSPDVIEFLRRPQQAGLVTSVPGDSGDRFFFLDKSAARLQARRQNDRQIRVRVPAANEMDDLVYGVIWAVSNLDSTLLEDDSRIVQSRQRLAPYRNMLSSAAGSEAADSLHSLSRAWLGSDFCARYITANLGDAPGAPDFWTREQTGEEACLWLFVAHKVKYLKETHRVSELSAPKRSTRTFCIPEDVARSGALHERLLLFLAVALMEAFDIEVHVSVDPRFADVEGFVLVPGSRALIANWVRAESIWHVDSKESRRALPDFAEPLEEAMRDGLFRHQESFSRLLTLADYLDIDWPQVRSRCRSLADSGISNLIQPKSRFLTLEGLDIACRYIAFFEKRTSFDKHSVGSML